MTPCESIIQNRTSEPTSGVTIIGSSEKKMTGPLMKRGMALTARAMTKPSTITSGVTMKV